jgi:hypothetical protein
MRIILYINILLFFAATLSAQCDISANSSGATASYTQVYVLTDDNGVVIAQNNSGTFPAVAPGAYRVYALNFNPIDPPAPLPANLIGQSVSLVGSQTAGCFNSDFFTDYVNRSCASCVYTRTICANAAILVNSSLSNTAYVQRYVLVDAANGLIVAVNSTGNFTGQVIAGNSYQIHALNFDPTNPPSPLPTVGQQLNSIGSTQNGCYNDDYLTDYICYNVTSCFDDCFRITSLCQGQNIVVSMRGQNTAYEQVYVFTDGFGNFISQNNTGVFPTNSLSDGNYRVYALNYSPTNPPNPLPVSLSVGSPISLVTGGCFNQDFLSDYLCFNLGCLLGGNLLSFSGEKVANTNKLSWSVAHPEKISRYILERSADGFSGFTEIYSLGQSEDYSFIHIDNRPLEKSYYRLKLIDLDNSVEYSSILFLEQELSEDFAIYPNPVNNTLNLRFDAQNSSTVQIRIFNTLGQLVLENFQDAKFGINTFSLPLDVLSSGEYYLQLSLSNKSSVLKFTKK